MRLIVIDDHPLAIQGIEAIVTMLAEMEVVGTASCCQEGLNLLDRLQPDIAIVDMRLSGESGLDLIRRGRTIAPGCRFIILTSYSSYAEITQAMEEKVEGYLLKDALPEEIQSAIRLVGKGRNYIDPAIIQTVLKERGKDPIEQLTAREKQVLSALARGKSNREIAAEFFVTEYTVKKHVSQILSKLGVCDRTQAALFAVEHGWGENKEA